MGTKLGLINSEHKMSPKVKREINESKLKKLMKIIENQEGEQVYSGLCKIHRVITQLIQDASTMEELELISIIVDEEPYINDLLDILLLHNESEEYSNAYTKAKGVIKKWQLVLM